MSYSFSRDRTAELRGGSNNNAGVKIKLNFIV